MPGPSSEVWHGDAYARQAAHHRSLDEWFLGRHPPAPTDVVIDAGCGTGEFTLRLAELVPEGHVIGVDPDPSMLAVAAGKVAANLEFRAGLIQELDVVCGPASADLVVARAVLHWLPLAELPGTYSAVLRTLTPGGWFHAESGGPGNLTRLIEALDAIAARNGLASASVTFTDAGLAMELLERAGFVIPDNGVVTVAQRRPFDREQLEGFVRTQASLAYIATAEPELRAAFLAEATADLDALRRHDGSYDQTFVRLDVLCQRPE